MQGKYQEENIVKQTKKVMKCYYLM